jgi:photosystem II stability/assembly factor-like uncharacterized protein
VVSGARDAWFATGGSGGGRVFRSTDRGLTWTDAATPIRNDSSSAGIFSLAFSGPRDGIAVGGDYTQPADAARNIAVTSDGGLTWKAPAGSPHGFRSAVAYLPALKLWIAVGTSGSDLSRDGGKTWTVFDSGAFNALAVAPTSEAWAVGPRGRIARFVPPE